MKPILNQPDDLPAIQSVSFEARINTQCDNEEPSSFVLRRDAVFRFGAWESELLWQVVQAIASKQNGYTEVREAMQQISKELQSAR